MRKVWREENLPDRENQSESPHLKFSHDGDSESKFENLGLA